MVRIAEIGPIDSISKWFCMSESRISYWILGYELSNDVCPLLVKVSVSKHLFVVSMRVLPRMGSIIERLPYYGVDFH